jgi:hypothetical protein
VDERGVIDGESAGDPRSCEHAHCDDDRQNT